MEELILDYIIPSLACILSLIIYGAPFTRVRTVMKNDTLDQTNPIPYSIAVANTIAWMYYAFSAQQNHFIFWANAPGFIISSVFTAVCYRVAPRNMYVALNVIGLLTCSIFTLIAYLTVFFLDTRSIQVLSTSVISITTCSLYASPLSTIVTVLKNKSTDTIDTKLTVAHITTSVLWVIYSIVISDIALLVLNSIGAFFSIIQVILLVIFCRKVTDLP